MTIKFLRNFALAVVILFGIQAHQGFSDPCQAPYKIVNGTNCDWNCAEGTRSSEREAICYCNEGYREVEALKTTDGRRVCKPLGDFKQQCDRGDITGDGRINGFDIMAVAGVVAGQVPALEKWGARAKDLDLNADSVVNKADEELITAAFGGNPRALAKLGCKMVYQK